jgi:uncharacterized protein YycO
MTGREFADFAISKLGTPYFYGAKMQVLTEAFMKLMHKSYPTMVTSAYMKKARNKGQVGRLNVDCSGLVGSFRGKQLGSAQLYSTAYTRLPISRINDFAVGTVLWKSGHVGIYIGNGECVEAKGINFGTVKTKVSSQKWKYGLTFKDIDYSYTTNLVSSATWKGKNPYEMPAVAIKKGQKGNGVKWLQWELREAGYDLDIDGSFGNITYRVVKLFQKSCKLEQDGVCGPDTKNALLIN